MSCLEPLLLPPLRLKVQRQLRPPQLPRQPHPTQKQMLLPSHPSLQEPLLQPWKQPRPAWLKPVPVPQPLVAPLVVLEVALPLVSRA